MAPPPASPKAGVPALRPRCAVQPGGGMRQRQRPAAGTGYAPEAAGSDPERGPIGAAGRTICALQPLLLPRQQGCGEPGLGLESWCECRSSVNAGGLPRSGMALNPNRYALLDPCAPLLGAQGRGAAPNARGPGPAQGLSGHQ